LTVNKPGLKPSTDFKPGTARTLYPRIRDTGVAAFGPFLDFASKLAQISESSLIFNGTTRHTVLRSNPEKDDFRRLSG
jgi:hypothetical protein